jgi:hypothetical protein
MRDGDSSSSELSAKEPISSFDGAVLERVGLGREELLDEGFGDLGDLGDLERFLGVEGEAFEVSSLTGTTFGATGFDGASFGDEAFDDGSFELDAFGVEVFEGADFDAFAGVDGTLFNFWWRALLLLLVFPSRWCRRRRGCGSNRRRRLSVGQLRKLLRPLLYTEKHTTIDGNVGKV